uniref:Uncharacterized protein n=1 Tax=Panagrolaimus davidi TaxID=227884 RepID=A0A914PW60_9BILA
MDDNKIKNSVSNNESQEKRSPEELLADILGSLEEYTTEKAEAIMSSKHKLLSILKTHRPIKIGNYHYGLSANLGKDRALIVFEYDNKRMVRQYYKNRDKYLWRCRICERRYYKYHLGSSYFRLYLVNGLVFVPNGHDCPPLDYEIVMQYQKYLEEGNLQLARRMVQLVDFTYGKSSFENIVNALNFSSLSFQKQSNFNEKENKIVSKTSLNLKRKLNDTDCVSSSSDKATVKKIKIGEKSCVNDEPALSINHLEKKENEAAAIPSTTFSFEKPSILTIKNICNKLNIKYCKEAVNFWQEIKFKEINILSKNFKTQIFKTKNLYKILSNFFTGKFCDYEQIYYAINQALCNKLVDEGKMTAAEIDSLWSSYAVTEQQFEFITEFLPCRILIFDANNKEPSRKYGKWKNKNINILTLVLSLLNRKYYSVVVDL